jgi:hypothetical protein
MGNPKFSRLARVASCAIGFVLFTTGISAGAESLYKFVLGGKDFYNYHDALIALDISNGTATGQLRPLLGDRTPPVNVRGTNPRDGVLDLIVDLPAGPKTYRLTKNIVGHKIVWQNLKDSSSSFYRYVDSPLSDAALTLGEYECGAQYGAMVANLRPQTTNDLLNSFLATDQQASSLPITYNEYDEKVQLWTKKTSISLGDFLKLQLRRIDGNRKEEQFQLSGQFEAPVGTEAYVAKWLRRSGLFDFADLDPGGCDGMDASYFVINRGLLFDADGLSQGKFEQYIGIRLNDFVSRDDKGKAWQFRLGQPFTKRINIPPYPLAYRTRVYAASEVTRHVPGWWDTFWVTFQPGELIDTKKTEYAVVVTIDRLKSSKRSAGNSSPPDDAYFTKQLELSDEAEVTAAVTQYFSRRDGGWCNVQLAGDEATSHHVVCDVEARAPRSLR